MPTIDRKEVEMYIICASLFLIVLYTILFFTEAAVREDERQKDGE